MPLSENGKYKFSPEYQTQERKQVSYFLIPELYPLLVSSNTAASQFILLKDTKHSASQHFLVPSLISNQTVKDSRPIFWSYQKVKGGTS